ncbi:MAG: TetR family transcriptional regulator [Ginsengibacter sp.]
MDKKTHILSTALKLFCQKGFEGTSVRDIAMEADVNLAMISYYFGSKEKLFQNALEYKASYLKGIFEELVSNAQMSAIDKIDVIIDSYVERIFSNPLFHHLLHRELSLEHRTQMHERIIDVLLKNVFMIKKIIEGAIEAKIFKKVDPELTVATLIGTINQLAMSETLCRKLLHKNKDFNPYQNKNFRIRVKDHLKQLMRSHLLIKNKA